ncbi:hypothetical protein [Rhizobium rhizogenes]|uniref:hypothetical protein n=1 Tax=Rhizobium rhizogenes TaxID=359 RepID=UPI0015745CB8|nr:hypothetical protein [Rhizobium rhizogenes]NTF43061.1 hypothetical protein [Rhizobium rhizogenes]
MKLVPEAWTVLVHAWSSRLMVICVLLQLLEQPISDAIQQFITGYSWWMRETVQILIAAVGVLAIWARVTFQSKLQQKITAAKVRRQIRARYGNEEQR